MTSLRHPRHADEVPLPVVGRYVRNDFIAVDVEDETGVVRQRQRVGLVVRCVRERSPVVRLLSFPSNYQKNSIN